MLNTEILNEIDEKGWVEFNHLNDEESLLKIANVLGNVIKHPNGNIIDSLSPKDKANANKNTFSHKFGFEKFPFHTDTAFWNIPTRYVLLSSIKNSQSATLFTTYQNLINHLSQEEFQTLEKSIFLVKTNRTNFYSSILCKISNKASIRYDSNCMKPMNTFAKEAIKIIESKLNNISISKISWDSEKIFIFDNWKVLHARDVVNNLETRILKRIYISL